MSHGTFKWFKTIGKVLCGLFFFAKIVVPILTSGGVVDISDTMINGKDENLKLDADQVPMLQTITAL